MSLLTRCPHCDTLFRVTPSQLQARGGKVRCGRCMNVFDGFQALAVEEGDAPSEPVRFDPERAPPTPVPPSAGASVDLAPPAPAFVEPAPPTTTYVELVPSASASVEPAPPTTTYIELVPSASTSGEAVPPTTAPVGSPSSGPASAEPVRETAAAHVNYKPFRITDVSPVARETAGDFPRSRAPAETPEVPLRVRTPAETPAATETPRESVRKPIVTDAAGFLREKASAGRQALSRWALWRWTPVKPTETTAWIAASVVAVILLAFQLVYAARGELAARNPTLKAMFTSVCRVVGCRLPLPHNPELVKIEASDVRMVDSSRPQLVQLTATLRSYAGYYLAYPALDLVLTNANEHALARRVFVPQEYLGRNRDPNAGLPPHAEITIALELDTGNQNAAGFRLDLLAAP
jgi:predicted Zn finger-like uncharacterized protein